MAHFLNTWCEYVRRSMSVFFPPHIGRISTASFVPDVSKEVPKKINYCHKDSAYLTKEVEKDGKTSHYIGMLMDNDTLLELFSLFRGLYPESYTPSASADNAALTARNVSISLGKEMQSRSRVNYSLGCIASWDSDTKLWRIYFEMCLDE